MRFIFIILKLDFIIENNPKNATQEKIIILLIKFPIIIESIKKIVHDTKIKEYPRNIVISLFLRSTEYLALHSTGKSLFVNL